MYLLFDKFESLFQQHFFFLCQTLLLCFLFILSFFLFLSLSQPNGSIVDRLGTPGGGAPLRTVSGNHVKTHLNTAKIIHFQERSRPEVENVIRYEKSPHDKQEYATDLSNTCHPSLLFDFVRFKKKTHCMNHKHQQKKQKNHNANNNI